MSDTTTLPTTTASRGTKLRRYFYVLYTQHRVDRLYWSVDAEAEQRRYHRMLVSAYRRARQLPVRETDFDTLLGSSA